MNEVTKSIVLYLTKQLFSFTNGYKTYFFLWISDADNKYQTSL